MVNIEMADILAGLGQHIAEIVEGNPDQCYIYAEADAGFQEAGVFRDVGDKVLYFDPDDELVDDIGRLLHAAEPDKKWAALHYDVQNGQFDAQFDYPDSFDPEETSDDRRERALRARFGDKPVIYPPPDEGFYDLTEADLPGD